jgi:hypothetical protein
MVREEICGYLLVQGPYVGIWPIRPPFPPTSVNPTSQRSWPESPDTTTSTGRTVRKQ